MKRTIWASVTVGLAALMTFGCGNVVNSDSGRPNDSQVPFAGGTNGAPGLKIWAVDTAGSLFWFDSDNPLAISAKITLTGLPAGERIVAIDCRPRTGVLYGISNTGKLFWLDKGTGAATLVGNGAAPETANSDIDFNPVVDRIRLESGDQNVVLHPGTGVATAQTDLTIDGQPAFVTALAYSNPVEAPTQTTLLAVSHLTRKVYKQTTPSDGVLTEIATIPAAIGPNIGFDIGPNGVGYLAAQRDGEAFSSLFRVDPSDGGTVLETKIASDLPISSIAVDLSGPTVTKFVGIDADKNLVRFNSNDPSNLISSNVITGIAENIVGCDFSAGGDQATGLKVLAVPTGGGPGKIYSVDLTPGASFAAGTLVSTTTVNLPDPAGKQFGVDIIPGAAGGTMVITAATGSFTGKRVLSGQSTPVFSTVIASGATTPLTGFSGYIPAFAFDRNFLGGGEVSGFGINFGQTGEVDSEVPFLQFVTLTASGFQGALGFLGQVTTEISELDIEPNNNMWFVGPRVELRTVAAGESYPVEGFSTLFQVSRPGFGGTPVGRVGGQPIKSFAIIPTLEQNPAPQPRLTEAP
ncbi:MAG: DUF4394 domain-containing protein [Candidatus Eremiobacteraeota bacterium]|nr:DUF4394 domain-containing protein [Candidatus Eremiobacteraeota bacterium]MCW5871302.1 DUF4394 domain-containing protein [Candidatus Eremiobacteraeota bacterium]